MIYILEMKVWVMCPVRGWPPWWRTLWQLQVPESSAGSERPQQRRPEAERGTTAALQRQNISLVIQDQNKLNNLCHVQQVNSHETSYNNEEDVKTQFQIISRSTAAINWYFDSFFFYYYYFSGAGSRFTNHKVIVYCLKCMHLPHQDKFLVGVKSLAINRFLILLFVMFKGELFGFFILDVGQKFSLILKS